MMKPSMLYMLKAIRAITNGFEYRLKHIFSLTSFTPTASAFTQAQWWQVWWVWLCPGTACLVTPSTQLLGWSLLAYVSDSDLGMRSA